MAKNLDCPHCGASENRVYDSRANRFGIRRRRECLNCGHRWVTLEQEEKHYKDAVSRDALVKRFLDMEAVNGVGVGAMIPVKDAVNILTTFPALR